MPLRMLLNASEDQSPLPAAIRERYGPFGFPEPVDPSRPYVSSNFVIGLDGRASFRELRGRTGGDEVSRSEDDRWLMDFLRAHHDGLILGAGTLREEPGPDGRGWDYGINDVELQRYRQETLRLGPQRIFVVSGSGLVDLDHRLFGSPRVEPWVVTTVEGAQKLDRALREAGRADSVRWIAVGSERRVDLAVALRILHREHAIRTLLCEGGPILYGALLRDRLVDEDFRTISLQVLGESTQRDLPRPTSYGEASFVPETAPWFRLVSLHASLPYHVFLRLRYEGPRRFTPDPRGTHSLGG